jgi:hypothetical protein
MLWLAELQPLTVVKCRFRMQYVRQPPTRKSIRFWDNKLRTISSLLHVKSPGKTQTSEEKTVTGRSYLDMLELHVLPQLPPQTIFLFLLFIIIIPQTILQQDGTQLHFCHHVRNHLDREMAGRWIGRGGPITWLPRSPDLTPFDFSCVLI